MRASTQRMAGWLFRENRVPHYQRLFQKHDGKRFFEKTPRSKYMVGAYQVSQYITLAGTMYMMTRLTLGYKTWW